MSNRAPRKEAAVQDSMVGARMIRRRWGRRGRGAGAALMVCLAAPSTHQCGAATADGVFSSVAPPRRDSWSSSRATGSAATAATGPWHTSGVEIEDSDNRDSSGDNRDDGAAEEYVIDLAVPLGDRYTALLKAFVDLGHRRDPGSPPLQRRSGPRGSSASFPASLPSLLSGSTAEAPEADRTSQAIEKARRRRRAMIGRVMIETIGIVVGKLAPFFADEDQAAVAARNYVKDQGRAHGEAAARTAVGVEVDAPAVLPEASSSAPTSLPLLPGDGVLPPPSTDAPDHSPPSTEKRGLDAFVQEVYEALQKAFPQVVTGTNAFVRSCCAAGMPMPALPARATEVISLYEANRADSDVEDACASERDLARLFKFLAVAQLFYDWSHLVGGTPRSGKAPQKVEPMPSSRDHHSRSAELTPAGVDDDNTEVAVPRRATASSFGAAAGELLVDGDRDPEEGHEREAAGGSSATSGAAARASGRSSGSPAAVSSGALRACTTILVSQTASAAGSSRADVEATVDDAAGRTSSQPTPNQSHGGASPQPALAPSEFSSDSGAGGASSAEILFGHNFDYLPESALETTVLVRVLFPPPAAAAEEDSAVESGVGDHPASGAAGGRGSHSTTNAGDSRPGRGTGAAPSRGTTTSGKTHCTRRRSARMVMHLPWIMQTSFGWVEEGDRPVGSAASSENDWDDAANLYEPGASSGSYGFAMTVNQRDAPSLDAGATPQGILARLRDEGARPVSLLTYDVFVRTLTTSTSGGGLRAGCRRRVASTSTTPLEGAVDGASSSAEDAAFDGTQLLPGTSEYCSSTSRGPASGDAEDVIAYFANVPLLTECYVIVAGVTVDYGSAESADSRIASPPAALGSSPGGSRRCPSAERSLMDEPRGSAEAEPVALDNRRAAERCRRPRPVAAVVTRVKERHATVIERLPVPTFSAEDETYYINPGDQFSGRLADAGDDRGFGRPASESGAHYLVQTNYDRWKADPTEDPRRGVVERTLEKLLRDGEEVEVDSMQLRGGSKMEARGDDTLPRDPGATLTSQPSTGSPGGRQGEPRRKRRRVLDVDTVVREVLNQPSVPTGGPVRKECGTGRWSLCTFYSVAVALRVESGEGVPAPWGKSNRTSRVQSVPSEDDGHARAKGDESLSGLAPTPSGRSQKLSGYAGSPRISVGFQDYSWRHYTRNEQGLYTTLIA